MRVEISVSTRKDKKYKAKFYYSQKLLRTTHFGARGYSDFTIHKDITRKKKYINRHSKNEDWQDFMSAGSLSRYILWNRRSLRDSIIDYKSRFNLK